jgi:hypothetical protein
MKIAIISKINQKRMKARFFFRAPCSKNPQAPNLISYQDQDQDTFYENSIERLKHFAELKNDQAFSEVIINNALSLTWQAKLMTAMGGTKPNTTKKI